MLAFGATACLAKSTEARDVLHAIHLASRGLHVLPPAGMEPADLTRPGAAHAPRGRGARAAAERPLERRDRRTRCTSASRPSARTRAGSTESWACEHAGASCRRAGAEPRVYQALRRSARRRRTRTPACATSRWATGRRGSRPRCARRARCRRGSRAARLTSGSAGVSSVVNAAPSPSARSPSRMFWTNG